MTTRNATLDTSTLEQKQPKRRKTNFFRANRGDSKFKRLIIHLILIGYCIISIYPLLRIFSVSLRPGNRVLSTDLSIIPPDATLENYKKVIDEGLLQWIWNSLAVTITTSIVGVIIAATSAYAFSRYKFKGRTTLLIYLLTTQMIPTAMLMVPIYILAIKLGLIGTYRGLVIAYSVTSVPFSIWILKGYYDTIPTELEEAAIIDGASPLQAFLKIILPLSTPALSITFLFNFSQAWNEFLIARVILGSNEAILTWPLGLNRLMGQYLVQWGQYNAGAIMVSIPVMILFMAMSKYMISGLTLGSVKG
ncbi:MAG: sugar ABC transporter permease [Pelolinea sp.]|jgi:arabinogalactan oligomer/maltooligosaccharide transport system permease protein|nr:sugar ABC transporter permease [Pelolinea sp.]